jgi:hypothetical protein
VAEYLPFGVVRLPWEGSTALILLAVVVLVLLVALLIAA